MNARARKRKRAHTSVKVIRSSAAGSAGGGACGEEAEGEKRGRVGIIVFQTTAGDIDVPSEWYATRYQRILSQRIKTMWWLRSLRGPTARIQISQSFKRGAISWFVTPWSKFCPARQPWDALGPTPGTCCEEAAVLRVPLTTQLVNHNGGLRVWW